MTAARHHFGLRRALRCGSLVAICWVGLLAIVTSTAIAAPPAAIDFDHSPAEIREAEELAPPITEPRAARELPHRNLDRDESEKLLEGAFGDLLEAPAGIFNDLQVKRFTSDNSAVVSGAQIGDISGEAPSAEESDKTFLLESTVPLRTEGVNGTNEVVDLGLENVLGSWRPSNPLVEVEIPAQLGDGISLPEAGVQIAIQGAPAERAPSKISDTAAFYPNVAPDTDLAVSPTPNGVETLTQVRSAEAPRTETFDLELPKGAVLAETVDGGAVATINGQPLISVRPPTALDAAGNAIRATLGVDGDSLRISITPPTGAAYPIVVDPYVEDSYTWASTGHVGWVPWNTGSSTNMFRAPDSGCSTYCYLRNSAQSGTYELNTQSYWQYAVPRFFTDYENPEFHQERPRSWVQAFNVGQITFATAGDIGASPGALFAVSDQVGAWRAAFFYPPNLTGSFTTNLNADHTGKLASFGLFSNARKWIANERYLLTGEAQVWLGDETAPTFGSIFSPTEWVNTQAKPFNFSVEDPGLGVGRLDVKTLAGETIGTTLVNFCSGTVRNPCPRLFRGAQEGHLANYAPASLPQGTNTLKLEASDPTSNRASANFQVKVDHTAPELSLSGSVTEQASKGKTLPQYTLRVEAKDGTTASPQSGAASAEIKVDGKAKKTWSPGCSTQNCPLNESWTISSSEYSVGKHKVEVVAIDGVGLKSPVRTVEFEIQRDLTKPAIAGSGSLVSGPEGWITQGVYELSAESSDPNGAGVTTLELKIDGKLLEATSQPCAAGSCALKRSYTVNTGNQTGGTHTVQLKALDGAGNVSEKSWTIRVDPKGHVSAAEAAETLEAVEQTTVAEPVAPKGPVAEAGESGLKTSGSGYESTGSPVPVNVSTDLSDGFSVQGISDTIDIEPVVSSSEATAQTLTNGTAAVSGNALSGVDSVSRPVFSGVMSYEAIREASAPEQYSWTVEMGADQHLSSINSTTAEVAYADGTEAFLISAEPAHDATGRAVSTYLGVSGNTLTLTVSHRTAGVVYPVVAGAAFETGYHATITVAPTQEQPPILSPSETEFIGYEWASPPEPSEECTGGGACSSSTVFNEKHVGKILCSHNGNEFAPGGWPLRLLSYGDYEEACGNPWTGEPGIGVAFREGIRANFLQRNPNNKALAEVKHLGSPTDHIDCLAEGVQAHKPGETVRGAVNDDCVWWGPTFDGGGASARWGKHITPVSWNRGLARGSCGDECGRPNPWESVPLPPLTYYVWAAHNRYELHETRCIDCY